MQKISLYSLASLLAVLCIAGGCDNRPANSSRQEILAEFPIPKKHDPILLPVTFKDGEYMFLFDTGSSMTILDTSFRQHLGEKKKTVQFTNALGRPTDAEIFDAPDAFLGPLNLRDCGQVLCADLQDFRSVFKRGFNITRFDGIIGMDLLKNYVIQMDFDNGRLLFLKSTDSPDLDWGQPFDLDHMRQTPHVVATVLDNIQVSFMLDTAYCVYNSLRTEAVEEILRRDPNVSDNATAEEFGVVLVKKSSVRVNDLALGPFQYRNLAFLDDHFSILGPYFLSRHLVTFDFPHNKLYLKKGAEFDRIDYNATTLRLRGPGLALQRNKDAVFVSAVDPNRTAYQAGIRADDIVLKVNDKDVSSCDLLKVGDLFPEKAQSSVTLTIKHKDQTKRISFPLQMKESENGTD
ncbi:MAG TPA: aspartyl protease family protein [Sedimentisphaerales bacterium]|nr:aspartyl protease family protein [Sedimentisphaerales bacterium]